MAFTFHVSFSPDERTVMAQALSALTDREHALRQSAVDIVTEEIGLGKAVVAAIVLKDAETEQVRSLFGDEVVRLIEGLQRVANVNKNSKTMETENFRQLLLALAEDVRVVLIMIAERAALMRYLNNEADSAYRQDVARETSFLYAPLAHRLGLYTIKTELEDLSLKFTNYAVYKDIARALNEKKQQRDAYIAAFIQPVKEKLDTLGLKFHIKGRTKSIHSIFNKMQKQQCGVDGIYDLFAIRIILDSALEKEKTECWQVYSVIADMYQPNPKRLRDWLSIPKSNGYESLHTTVLGPENKWVEVQIRTERMDEIAEKGVAAHWKYKGGKSEEGLDAFLKNVREMLESEQVDTPDTLSDFRLNLYDDEVFVFSPNGDLFKLPMGSTVLDFAFAIHSGLGSRCVGGKIAGKNVPIKYVLHNGDQVEILQSATQRPTEAWLKIVKTGKARNKIRQALKEIEYKEAADGRELLERRFKNWKIDYEEASVGHLAKKMGYKSVSDFYQALATGKLDIALVRERYQQEQNAAAEQNVASVSAQNFVQQQDDQHNAQHDELVIDSNLQKVDYKLAKCCNPIYGDPIFGFVSITSGVKIHRADCPNAADMKSRFPYRVIPAKWSGKAVGNYYPITLRVVGHDDIGIVSGITSLINKENGVLLRTISIDSHDGIFEGHLTLLLSSTVQLDAVQRKIAGVKGVKAVERA